MLHKKDEENLTNRYGRWGKAESAALFLKCTSGAIQDRFDISPSFLPFRKAGGLQIRRYQGLAVAHYGFTLGALALKPSGFCNIGVYIRLLLECPVRTAV